MNADRRTSSELLADKGYDTDFIREDMERRRGVAMIPTKRNRLIQLPVDLPIYALRNMVERCFNKLKSARRLATRHDKTADSYLGFIQIVSIRLWMREFVSNSSGDDHLPGASESTINNVSSLVQRFAADLHQSGFGQPKEPACPFAN